MPTLDPIRIAMLPKGEYSASVAYDFLDVITFNGILYCCLTATSAGESPSTASAKWQQMTSSDIIYDGGNAASLT